MVQNVANIWPIDNQNYFLTFEHNCHKKLLPEVGQNGAFQENQHFYVVSKLEKKSKFTHMEKGGSKFTFFVLERVSCIELNLNLSGTETIGHFLLDFLVIHKVKLTKKVIICRK